MIPRDNHLANILDLLHSNPVVGLIGARQTGKTTLARHVSNAFDGRVTFFDLENPEDAARLQEPLLALSSLQGLVILDEIHHKPDIFKILRVLVDDPECKSKYLILGSASPELLRQSSESLAGRIAYSILPGFSADEIGLENLNTLWLRGGFPRAFLAKTDELSYRWRKDFVSTILSRDLFEHRISISPQTLLRFWKMLAHYHGQVWNASEFSRSFGLSDSTVRRYVDLLSDLFLVMQLQPWHENLKKRQIKSPRIFLSDSGLLHALLGLKTEDDLLNHPRLGASWEGFGIHTLMARFQLSFDECYFWATHAGAELDLMVIHKNERYGFEIKRTANPVVTKSMRIALQDLNLEHVYVIHAGNHVFQMDSKITAIPLNQIWNEPMFSNTRR